MNSVPTVIIHGNLKTHLTTFQNGQNEKARKTDIQTTPSKPSPQSQYGAVRVKMKVTTKKKKKDRDGKIPKTPHHPPKK